MSIGDHRVIKLTVMKFYKILSVGLATIIVLATLHAVRQVQTNNQVLHLKEIKLRNVQQELNTLDTQYQKLQNDKSKSEKQKQQEIDKLRAKEKALQSQLEARRLLKAQEARVYAATASQSLSVAHTNYTGTGSWYLDWIVDQESSGDPYARNSSSGACGLFQALPCSKLPCALSDVSCQISWGRSYAISRYGSFAAAYTFWVAHKYW